MRYLIPALLFMFSVNAFAHTIEAITSDGRTSYEFKRVELNRDGEVLIYAKDRSFPICRADTKYFNENNIAPLELFTLILGPYDLEITCLSTHYTPTTLPLYEISSK